MRLACVGDIHGREHLDALRADLLRLESVDLFLLAGDMTDRNDKEAFGEVIGAIRARTETPLVAVFGNNEYAADYDEYRRRWGAAEGVRFLHDEAGDFEAGGRRLRIIGSLGVLDRPTWWQRKNMPHLAGEYERRVATIDRLLVGGGTRVLLTHYPPTHATMGGEKEAWRPELGSKALEAVVLRRRPDLVVHGHVHKGIPYAELGRRGGSLDAFLEENRPVPVHNVAFPVRRTISVLEV